MGNEIDFKVRAMRYAAYLKQISPTHGRLVIRDNKTGKDHKCVPMRGAGRIYLWVEDLEHPVPVGIPRDNKDTWEAVADRIARWLNTQEPCAAEG